ncbi:cell wall hydrolase [Rhizobium rhizogenes]|uniref:cell wall hydrolase n=1 Tax=Rhizobium rhizogenes TaxID=359 RepID=UPI00056B6C57|nr:cell wall hydrolase [Rhizobium rhizogenes]NTH77201.1 cell wall hydrolase [Rhizobium rhizogenes]NTH83209.1 cell wall hydrolase [Rhizobium rhizogenes]NTI22248.1 cell wall hydrolase [Rhizobium rhizogenes]NTI61587.1 cell wall hydrolase [Rhizobium rhizogenes]NTI74578.1 cell wall hydrolase [Rhizobium rhizogenes]
MRAQGKLGTCLSGLLFVGLAATGCTTDTKTSSATHSSTKSIQPAKVTYNYTAKDRDCLKRVMYFESEHSDHDGYMAVGTVVMNRLTSGAYANSICGVVAQERQFAPGVMTRLVRPEAEPELDTAATAILRGERHAGVKDAMFFHTNGLKFPYNNMHYVAIAGGNAFYEKRGRDGELQTPAPLPAYEVAMNYVSTQGISTTQSPFILPETRQVQQAPSVVAFTPVSNPTFAMPAATAAIPAEVPIPTPAPALISVPVTHGTAVVEPISTIAIPQPRPDFEGEGYSGNSVRIRG